MIGAIIGDIIGSRFEKANVKHKEFELFTEESSATDDSILSIAIADCILNQKDYAETVKAYARKYPLAGYGGTFLKWMAGLIQGPYNSWGNGSAMRVSPIGFAYDNVEQVLEEAEKSAAITHNHPEGIKGAQAIALAVFMARNSQSKEAIKKEIEERFSYDLSRKIDEIRPVYEFDVSCQGSVPEAIIAFLESAGFEDAIRTAISIGGDSDTIASMAGALAEAFYKEIPQEIIKATRQRLDSNLLAILDGFEEKYGVII